MTIEQLRRVRALFDAALAVPLTARAEWCALACTDDPGVRLLLGRLLQRDAALTLWDQRAVSPPSRNQQ